MRPFGCSGVGMQPMAQVGAPVAGTWVKGVVICDAAGKNWRCIADGTPGSWEEVGSGGGGGYITILDRIQQALEAAVTVTVTGVAAGDLQAAVAAAVDGDVIEVQTNATYSPITLPAGKTLTIRAGKGYGPKLTGTNCVNVDDGAADHIMSGFGFTGYTTGDNNAMGAGITFTTQGSKCSDLIFHNLHFEEATSGSAVMMSYHRTVGGDNYANPPQPSEMSDGIAFVQCHFYRACKDGTEGAELALRAFKNPFIYDCRFDGDGLNARGIQLQNCTDIWVEKNRAQGFPLNNGEGIKIDTIGSPVAIRNTGWVLDNDCVDCIEGIDCDDYCDVVVLNNRCVRCSDEGISIDGGTAPAVGRVLAVGNDCSSCGKGILAEAGSVCELAFNACWDNTTNYSILNGYVLPGSNITVPRESVGRAFLGGGRTRITVDSHLQYQTTVWDDLTLAGLAVRGGASEPPIEVYRGGIRMRHWGVGDEGHGNFHLRHSYKPGTSVEMHLHVKLRTGTIGVTAKVNFELEYTLGRLNAVDAAPVTVTKEFDISGLAQYTEGYLVFNPITMVGYSESSNITFRLKRIAASSDEYADKIAMAEVDTHFEAEKLGTLTTTPGSGP